jgi:NAD(P)-dependent dehydrogenase (short-subunit alcohol dehydrogenase family)
MKHPFAVILGAGPGIGLAVARRFNRSGFATAVVSRPGDPLADFQAELEAQGAPALALGAGLGDSAALGEALRTLETWGGFPQVLVYNASAGTPGPAADLDPAQVLGDLGVNVAAPLACVRWALPAMRAAGRGTLLFTGGGSALHPKPGMASACLGKAALRSLALSLGEELAGAGIHAATVTVCGYVQPGTPLSPDRVAQAFWDLHSQEPSAWVHEVELR